MILIDDDDDDVISVLQKIHGFSAADAAAVAQAVPAERIRDILAYVDANPKIVNPRRYIRAAVVNESKPRKPRRTTPQLSLVAPAPIADLEPPADASWVSDADREARAARAIQAAKLTAFPALAKQTL